MDGRSVGRPDHFSSHNDHQYSPTSRKAPRALHNCCCMVQGKRAKNLAASTDTVIDLTMMNYEYVLHTYVTHRIALPGDRASVITAASDPTRLGNRRRPTTAEAELDGPARPSSIHATTSAATITTTITTATWCMYACISMACPLPKLPACRPCLGIDFIFGLVFIYDI